MAAIIVCSLPVQPVFAAAVPSDGRKRPGSAPHNPLRSASPRIQRGALRHVPFEGSRGGLRCAARAAAGTTQSGGLPELRPSLALGYFGRTLATAVSRFLVLKSVISEAIRKGTAGGAVGSVQPGESETLARLRGSLACAVSPLCFAAMSRSAAAVNTPLTVVASGMAKWLELYSGVLMVRVLLSWFPNIPWERQPLQAMRDMCDPYLNLYRNIIPPLFNALDLSPLLAFLVLGLLSSILNTSIRG